MCSMQMYYMHTHYKDKVPGSMHSRVFLSSLQSGGRGRGGGNSRRSVSDGSPDLTGSFTSDFIQPHAGTLHMVKLSQAHTHMHSHTLPRSHTQETRTFHSSSTRKWLLFRIQIKKSAGRQTERRLTRSRKFVPLLSRIKIPSWEYLDSRSEQGVPFSSSHSEPWIFRTTLSCTKCFHRNSRMNFLSCLELTNTLTSHMQTIRKNLNRVIWM